MPDHLIGIGNGVIAVSRTFAWSRGVPYAPHVLASKARAVHLPGAHAVTFTPTKAQLDPQLPNCISTWFRAQLATTAGVAGTQGNNKMSLIRAVNVFGTTKHKRIS